MARVAFPVTTCHEFEGIKVLAAMLRTRGHQVQAFVTSEEPAFRRTVAAWRPDVIGLYATTGQETWARSHVLAWRQELAHLKVVMGGPHPSFDADILYDEEYVDAIVKAEAEFAVLDLVEAWEAGRGVEDIPNVGVLRDGVPFVNPIRPAVQDLDSLPFPDVDVFYRYPFLRSKRVMQVHASRGCQNNCTYCSVPLMKREWVSGAAGERFNRTKSVDYLCEEMNDILARYPGFRMVNFGDAALNLKKGWLAEFADKWPERVRLPFACNININYLDEEEIVMLKRAGCVSVQFGLESGNEDVRMRVYKKGYTDEFVHTVPALLRKHRITYRTNNIMGAPEETLEDMFETVRTNRAIKPNGCTVLIYRPFKSTELGRQDFRRGRVDADRDIGPSLQSDSQMMRDDLREVVNLQKLFNVAVYAPGGEALVRRLVKMPRNPAFDWTLLAFLWYQHAVVSGYGMLDDFALGLKNLGQIFGRKIGGTHDHARRSATQRLVETLDTGNQATI